MARAQWHIIGALEDIDDSVFLWDSIFKFALDSHIKRRTLKIRDKSLPWINSEIRKAINQCQKYLRKALVNPGTTELRNRCTPPQERVKKVLRIAEASFWFNPSENATHWDISGRTQTAFYQESKIKKCEPIYTRLK